MSSVHAHAGRTYDDLKRKLQAHLRELFPIEGKKNRLELTALEIKDDSDMGDYTSQKAARMDGKTWSVPVIGTFVLKGEGGKVLNRAKMRIIDLPALTNRGSYIVGGSEYMFPTQKRLRSGPYVRTGQNNELRTFFNMAKGRNFHLGIHPEKGHLQFQIDTSKNIPLYPLLRALGVSDEKMIQSWGREAFAQNVVRDSGRETKALKTIFEKMSYGEEAPTPDLLAKAVAALFDETEMDGDNAELTLGKKIGKANGQALLLASAKMMRVGRGEEKEDNRDSLIHNDMVDLSDFIVERFKDYQFRSRIQRTIKFNLDRRDKVSQIISRDAFQRPADSLFTESQLSQSPIQTNPLGMISDYTAVTVRGEGGIQQDNALTKGLRALDPSHLGFLDPAHTPEGSGVGTTLHLTTGTKKKDKDLVTKVLDVKTGKEVDVTPVQVWKSVIAFPEAVDPKTRKLRRGLRRVKASVAGDVQVVPVSKVDYAFIVTEHLMDVNTASIPFTSHNNGARVMLASKLGVQAKPLADSEPPLVQSGVPGSAGTVERAVGESFSPVSPVAGKVEKITDDFIQVSGKKVSIPNYFPLNNNNFVHATPVVKVGDKVKKGQVLADTNYTKKGDLALGKNLLVGYMPYKGMNVEDGVVISRSAAAKMTSEHLYQQPYPFDTDTVLDIKRFQNYFPAKVTTEKAAKLDDKGVVKKGQTLKPGDLMVVAMRKQVEGTESQQLARISKILAKEYRDDSMVWDKDVEGVVQEVAFRPSEVVIHVRTKEPMRVGDKIVGRYANKGIVVHVMPDSEMPVDEKKRPMDMIMNPNGVVSRMNLGQIMETTASKIAEKTGKPFVAKGFGEDSSARIRAELKKNGLKDHETVYDPTENAEIPGVLVGKQYIYKLEHQATKKISARGGGADEVYSDDEQPVRGKAGGRGIGTMELYAMLAHGALANVHEMYGVKSSFDPEVWRAVESGAPLPPGRSAFSQTKFTSLLKGMGVDVKETGKGELAVLPFLDKQVKKLSSGEITDHKLLRGKDLKEEKNGLFDTKKTGGVRGERWTHLRLPEPVPNPTFEKAVLSLLHMKKSEFGDIMAGKKKYGALTGGRAIQNKLAQIDVKKRLAEAEKQVKGKKGAELNALHREIRYLRTLKEHGIKPQEYVIENVPVLPPRFRPVYTLPDGNLNVSDINFHYQALIQLGQQMKEMKGKEFDSQRGKLNSDLYKAVGGVMGLNDGIVERAKPPRGIASILAGKGSPKTGYIHGRMLKRRQDVSATNVIVANPKLGIDEIGLPEATAWKTFRPFAIRELRTMGMTPLQAKKAIDDKTPHARKALEKVVGERHVIINRAPTLHKFSVMAFKPRLVPGYAMEIPPLIVGGFNADFDGDTMGIHVPLSAEANAEAAKMLPSKHLYKPGSKKLQPKIEHEYVLGLFKISRPNTSAVRVKRFNGKGEVLSQLQSRKIDPAALISVTGLGSTTPGRILINEALPMKLRDYGEIWTDKAIQKKLIEVDKVAGRKAFVNTLQRWADIGRKYAYLTGSSFLLSDLQSMNKQRNSAYRRADQMAERIRMGGGSTESKKKKIVELYMNVSGRLSKKVDLKQNSAKKSNNVMDMMQAGARGNPNQVRQMVSNIGVMLDHENRPMPEPVRGTYAEGLDSAEFFQHMYGNRKGMIDRSQSVKDPGALTKQVIVSAAGFRVSSPDCHTTSGINESTSGTAATDRYMAEAVKGVGSRGTLVTSAVIAKARAKNMKNIRVRSPLTCRAAVGVCSKCYGLDEEGKLPPVGEHVGIKDAQGLTEPSTQLAMKTFHTGGVATTGKSLTTGFDRVKQLFTMPDNMLDKATLAEIGGRVESLTSRPQGGWIVVVNGKRHQVARTRKPKVKVGDRVEKGEQITDGNAQPQDVLRLRGLRQLQTQLRDDIHNVYAAGGEHINHKTIETPVRMLTETVRISDPGGHPSLVTGDYSTYGRIDDWNRTNKGKGPVRYTHQLPGSEYLPHRTDDWAQRMAHNRIQQVLTEAPAMGAKAKIQGQSPFAALMTGKRIKKDPWAQGGLTHG
jgi:DNA-directed RNA polymerase subunit beta'